MSQIQKLYGKWLVAQAAPVLDQDLPETQFGYRRGRQPAEALHVIARIVAQQVEWSTHVTLIKLDLRKAFDSLNQSCILRMLLQSRVHPCVAYSLARELVGSFLKPEAFGCTSPERIAQRSGTKQGAPESGILFVASVEKQLQDPSLPPAGPRKVSESKLQARQCQKFRSSMTPSWRHPHLSRGFK